MEEYFIYNNNEEYIDRLEFSSIDMENIAYRDKVDFLFDDYDEEE